MRAGDSGKHVAQAARPARIAEVAGAASRGDVRADALGRPRPSRRLDLGANGCVRLAKAVAEQARAIRPLLPHVHSQIAGVEAIASSAEVDNGTGGVGAKAIVAGRQPRERTLGEERLHGLKTHGNPPRAAGRAARLERGRGGRGTAAAGMSLHAAQYRPWSALQSQGTRRWRGADPVRGGACPVSPSPRGDVDAFVSRADPAGADRRSADVGAISDEEGMQRAGRRPGTSRAIWPRLRSTTAVPGVVKGRGRRAGLARRSTTRRVSQGQDTRGDAATASPGPVPPGRAPGCVARGREGAKWRRVRTRPARRVGPSSGRESPWAAGTTVPSTRCASRPRCCSAG